MIQDGLQSQTIDDIGNDYFLDAMSSALEHCLETFQILEKATDEICPKDRDDLPRWTRFKISVSDSTLKSCHQELRWQVAAAHRLYSVFQL
jgi:hypothetical protein